MDYTTIYLEDKQPYVAVFDSSGWQLNYIKDGKLHPNALPPDFTRVKKLGIAGIIHRIGNGGNLDQSFDLVYHAAKKAGIPIGAYYYAQPNNMTAETAVKYVLNWVNSKSYQLDMPLMLDWEEYYGPVLSPENTDAWITEFCTRAGSILYGGNAFINARTCRPLPADLDTIQPRYPRQGVRPPVDPRMWPSWIPWMKQPMENGVLGAWEGWQFSADGYARAYGYPSDGATDRLDLNIVKLDVWNKWRAPYLPKPEVPEVPPTTTPPDITVSTPRVLTNIKVVEQVRIFDTRQAAWAGRGPSNLFAVPLPKRFHELHDPQYVWVTLTAVPITQHAGFLNDGHGTSFVNFQGAPAANTILLPVSADGYVAVGSSVNCHLVVDLVAFH